MRSWQCLVFACLVACGDKSPKSQAELASEHGSAIKAKLEAIKAAGAAARGAPDNPSVTTVPNLSFDDLSTGPSNALATMYDDTQDPTSDSIADRFTGMKDDVRAAKALVGVKMATPLYFLNETDIGRIESAKYVLVVYRVAFTAPKVTGNGSFSPGAARSTNVLVELGTNKILGSFTVDAESSDKVTATNADGHLGADQHYQDYLNSDLRERWGKAIADGIKKRWRGAQTPSSF